MPSISDKQASVPIQNKIESTHQPQFDDQQQIDLANFDAIVEKLNEEDKSLTNSVLIDALLICLKLRKHVGNNWISSIALTNDEQAIDLANDDRIVEELNEQKQSVRKSQLIDLIFACLKLREQIEKLDSAKVNKTSSAANDNVTATPFVSSTLERSSESRLSNVVEPNNIGPFNDDPVDPLPMQNQHEELQLANFEHQVTVESTDNNAVTDIQSLVTSVHKLISHGLRLFPFARKEIPKDHTHCVQDHTQTYFI